MAKLVVLFSFTVKYKLPSALFSSHVRLNNLWSALEGFPAEGLEVPEACGLHPSPEVSKSTAFHTYKNLFLLNGTIKFTKSCWQPLGQGWRRRQLRRVVNVSDSQSSSPGFELHSGHYLKLFHVILEFSSSATLVNNRLVWF